MLKTIQISYISKIERKLRDYSLIWTKLRTHLRILKSQSKLYCKILLSLTKCNSIFALLQSINSKIHSRYIDVGKNPELYTRDSLVQSYKEKLQEDGRSDALTVCFFGKSTDHHFPYDIYEIVMNINDDKHDALMRINI